MELEEVLSEGHSEDEVDDEVADFEELRVCMIIYMILVSKFIISFTFLNVTLVIQEWSDKAFG
ncbi:uncharacterized protein DS421_16g543940 [Arachis hypogaea]|nr:uncharacterized protein DS421_16g543940 [Arachis hypogaea]